jgi:methyl-accepting chemotaxis protein
MQRRPRGENLMTLRAKLLAASLSLAVIPLAVMTTAILWQTTTAFDRIAAQTEAGLKATSDMAGAALTNSGEQDLEHVARDVYAMCQAQQELLQQKVNYDLNVARDVLEQAGPVSFADETVPWQSVNQYTKAVKQVDLPKMLVGDQWLGQNRSMTEHSPVVDGVKQLVGGTCTIFQRMNETGDMLRVCTNVEKLDGTRAIGTFIPAVNPDGKPNPVISTTLNGQTFRGRAYVVNAWYITAYEPIRDASGQVVGVLYVGVPEQATTALRDAIMSIEVGQTGYVYVLNATGNTRGHYVISKDGARDGEDIWNAQDANGRLFIQEICQLALQLKPDEIGQARYPWQNPGDPAPRDKVVKIAYFAPWDWVIGVGSYEDEFYGAVRQMEKKAEETLAAARQEQSAAFNAVAGWVAGIGGLTLLFSIVVALVMIRGIVKPVNRMIHSLKEGAEQVNDAATQVASSSQQLAGNSSEQASSLEQTSSALEEMAAMTRTNANNARKANELATQARGNADQGDHTMTHLNNAMTAINESSAEIGKIIKVIEEIAFQTNLLALNAAVEAARAGEHGKGFAVVAEEVRNLAQRSAQAARDTTALIEESVNRAKEGTTVATSATDALQAIVSDVAQVADLLNGIAQASQEQAQGVEQVNTAVAQMDKVTQQNAAGAEESASAAEQLSAQAQAVKSVVEELVALVGKDRRGTQIKAGPGYATPQMSAPTPSHSESTDGRAYRHQPADTAEFKLNSAPKTGPSDRARPQAGWSASAHEHLENF